jgi:hypothetical protein
LDVDVAGQPLTVGGYLKQSVGYGVAGNQLDTKQGLQSFVTQALVEVKYVPRTDLSFFVSGKGNADWAYDVFAGNTGWNQKLFNTANDHLAVFDDWQDILNEAHVSYANDGFFLRFGKQVVAWGETDGFRLMDQINPVDQRRGIGDVTYENTIIPVWLLRTEYHQQASFSWVQDLTYQFVFNPNFKYRGSQDINPAVGTEGLGIWALNVAGPNFKNIPGVGYVPVSVIPTLPAPLQAAAAHIAATPSSVGSFNQSLNTPGNFSSDGFKYAPRISGTIYDTRITINGFYGPDNDFVWKQLPGAPQLAISPYNGSVIVHPYTTAYYPLLKFLGATASRDLDFLKCSALGGVAPVLRLESLYAFNSTFMTSLNTFEKHDEIRTAVGIDWKVKVPLLNESAYFFISPQVYDRKIENYSSDHYLFLATDPYVRENTWYTTLLVNTSYLHNKLQPSFFWMHDYSNRCGFIKPELAYEWSDVWKYALGAVIISGDKVGDGLQPLADKSYVYLSATYRF